MKKWKRPVEEKMTFSLANRMKKRRNRNEVKLHLSGIRSAALIRMKCKIGLLILFVICLSSGIECKAPLEKYFYKHSTLQAADILLGGGNPLDTILDRFEKMDTNYCFEFKILNGPQGIGKLVKSNGFGLDKFKYQIGNESGSISVENLVEVGEFHVDLKKYVKFKKKIEIGRNASNLGFFPFLCASILIVSVLLWATSNGSHYQII